ncbi:MAG: sigma-70 family RNA polymerase sigma factor [Candidatus Thiodiazotropha sp. (ex Lucinoma borealis)]|nr:sigma-70 family RNA polymerase sigma factor [Candidatus Thiodiazotropha sp. (ex Lucinoma borealis)]MCU7841684.1 sigma-70 family RNA polymerase sigma factor [Candidatus Thiodiazotropha sp. (ex Troendleina suluensis)]MCU7864433.1 sigma-70 family RNA polymerase sigma factor [Candidatus Thiodiazotropha sp. (ex Lucinoma borealis)]MCU7869373.1 sigma-70 family RNA polymerase sigma factor [Candidatus Thiodiazotropha sp. (ex Lucinoma borealis)]MCU7947022.1 sigma-70 family RNA polymerase sigma factor 
MSTGNQYNTEEKSVRNQELETLLSACALNDQKAFTRLYQMTSANLYGLILRLLSREAWAKECLQEAFIKIWNNAAHYRPYRAAPLTWMMAIARNQALDHLRKHRRELMEADGYVFSDTADNDPLPLENLIQSDEGEQLKRCLDLLKDKQRHMIVLAYFKGLSHNELAIQTNTPLGTVKTRIRHGLAQLRLCMESC